MPNNLPLDFYGTLTQLATKHHKKFLLDTSGQTLKESLKYKPFFIKPNKDEIEQHKKELYKLTISREKDMLEANKKAKLNFRTIKIEGSQNKMTIKNNGKSTARNVRLDVKIGEEAKKLLFREMYSVLPATIQAGNEITFKYKTIQRKKIFNAELIWDDEYQKNNIERI